MNEDLIKVKDKYGEEMMHLCRRLFPTLLETPGLLFSLLESKFNYSKTLCKDIIENDLEDEFKNYIYGLTNIEIKEVVTDKTPSELLSLAGYQLFICETNEDIEKFKRYYADNERICTFSENRLNRCHVFFAVKNNVDDIRRESFTNPRREDEYGTSVISIQFTKGKLNTLSIKNRYNQTVNNPDATFSNNLDNIIPGLTYSFNKYYNLNINKNSSNGFTLTDYNYVRAHDGKYYKYNYKIGDIYYCPKNIIIDKFNVVRDYEATERYIVMDYFILDLQNKKISLYDKNKSDSFLDGLSNIDKISVVRSKETGNRILNIKSGDNNIIIELDKYNRIIHYTNKLIENIGDNFLYWNNTLTGIDAPNLTKVGSYFLERNNSLIEFNAPVRQFGSGFLSINSRKSEILSQINNRQVEVNSDEKTENYRYK